MKYASLIGPLLGVYYPLPFEDELENRVALNSSRLEKLWCAIYEREQVELYIRRFGGTMLPEKYARALDYDSFLVDQARQQRGK